MRVVMHAPIRGVGEGFSSLGLLVRLGLGFVGFVKDFENLFLIFVLRIFFF
jgi:hypothetical protein